MDWMTVYLDEHIQEWIDQQGGWVSHYYTHYTQLHTPTHPYTHHIHIYTSHTHHSLNDRLSGRTYSRVDRPAGGMEEEWQEEQEEWQEEQEEWQEEQEEQEQRLYLDITGHINGVNLTTSTETAESGETNVQHKHSSFSSVGLGLCTERGQSVRGRGVSVRGGASCEGRSLSMRGRSLMKGQSSVSKNPTLLLTASVQVQIRDLGLGYVLRQSEARRDNEPLRAFMVVWTGAHGNNPHSPWYEVEFCVRYLAPNSWSLA
ncbi:hypothetical protein WMY93_027169 [Mugilogobius chulae]|uniref:Uncharacterized protein n=1 Tax=Mugilogobius chulae TaxID=88201 RepID=A0AAW0MT79_9GOBI